MTCPCPQEKKRKEKKATEFMIYRPEQIIPKPIRVE